MRVCRKCQNIYNKTLNTVASNHFCNQCLSKYMWTELKYLIPEQEGDCDCGGTGGKHHPICPESPIEKARQITSNDIDVCGECLLAYDIKEGHECDRAVHQGRTFNSGAYRDGENGKLDYSRALCPNVMERYLEFLSANRKQSNKEMRDFDNWKKGIPVRSYLSSMMRHVWTVWKYFVGFKKPKTETGDIVDELCAIMFNVNGLIHVILKARERKRQRLEREK